MWVTGSSRFKLPPDLLLFKSAWKLGFLTSITCSDTFASSKLGFLPIFEASNISNPAAGRKIKSVQYFKTNLMILCEKLFLNRWWCFLRFLRTRARIRLSSSESSSSATEIDMLLLLLGSFGDAIVRKEIVIVCNKSVVKNEDFEIGILGDYILLSSPLFGDFSFLVRIFKLQNSVSNE